MANGFEDFTVVVTGIEGGHAVLATADGQKLVVKKKLLPKFAKEGEILSVELLTTSQLTERRKNLTKAILNEILGGGTEKVGNQIGTTEN